VDRGGLPPPARAERAGTVAGGGRAGIGGDLLARLVQRLRRFAARRELPVWYSPLYRLPLSGVETAMGLEPRRADFVAWWLVQSRTVRQSSLKTPRRISYDDLDHVHTVELLESLGRPETLARIFAAHPAEIPVDEINETIRLACGATVEAAREALRRRGPTLNLLGGFHHAGPGSAGGFCPINDVAVAVAVLRSEGFGGRVAVLDLDAHPPDGTAACFRGDGSVWIGSLSGSDWGSLPGVDETLLATGCGDDVYLAALTALLGRMPRPALAFVLAGGDVLAGDRFGQLGLTLAGARARDLAVVRELEGVPSVWLPAGGYHADSWRALAGTAVALTSRSRRPIPRGFDPVKSRFADIAREMTGTELSETEFSSADIEEALGLAPRGSRQRLWLRYYTASGIEHALYRFGILDHLRRLGYGWFRVEFDVASPGDRVRLLAEWKGEPQLLMELVAERGRVAGADVLYVHWLSLRNPAARFTPVRPKLPGQEVPGLGLAREIGEILALVARRLELAGVVFRPAHYHTAYSARHNLMFVDPVRQGRFEALVRDLAHVSLLEATEAVASGRVLLLGEPYTWEADEMALWLKHLVTPQHRAETTAECERCRFTIAP
jgi:acetoin utilization deacetylase AcuC-like enzyme